MDKINGLLAATYTPLHSSGNINTSIIPDYQDFLYKKGLKGLFINGSTGDFSALSTADRMDIIEAWAKVKREDFLYFAHVGSNNINEAKEMALHAEKNNMDAISILSPFYFKPKNLDALIDYCAEIANSVSLPFYYYHLPQLTGVDYPMTEFLKKAEGKIQNLAGIKYSKVDIIDYKRCLEYKNGKYDILFGSDENLLSAISIGGRGAVGSTYNFIPTVHNEIIRFALEGNIEKAADLQFKSIKFVEAAASINFWGATKALFRVLGLDMGPVKPPSKDLTQSQVKELLDKIKMLELNELKL